MKSCSFALWPALIRAKKPLMKKVITYLLLISLGIILAFWFFSKRNSTVVTTSGDVIVERIKAVKKIVVTEAQFSEVYNFKEAKKYFYDLISFEKKALLLVKGNVKVSYDLEKITYEMDKESKTITLTHVPKPETSIEPSIKYYDLQESTFNSFNLEDYNRLNGQAIQKLKTEIEKSNLYDKAESNLQKTLEELQWVGKELGWKVKIKSKT